MPAGMEKVLEATAVPVAVTVGLLPPITCALPLRKVSSASKVVLNVSPAAAVVAVFLMRICCTMREPPFTVVRLMVLVAVRALRAAALAETVHTAWPAARGAATAAARATRATVSLIAGVGWRR